MLRDDGNSGTDKSEAAQRRDRIAKRAAKELKEGVSRALLCFVSPIFRRVLIPGAMSYRCTST